MEFNFHTKDRERTKPGSAKKQSEGVNTTNYPQTLRNFNSADNYNPNFVSTIKVYIIYVCVQVLQIVSCIHVVAILD